MSTPQSIPGFSGCLEHITAKTQLIREADVNNSDLTVVLIDLANAYGSIPYKVIEHAMDHYHIPDKIKILIRSYYSNFRLRLSTPVFTTDWIKIVRIKSTGCTVSVIFFVLGMDLILKAVEQETGTEEDMWHQDAPIQRVYGQYHHNHRIPHPSKMDTVCSGRNSILFKPSKSRYLVLKKGKILPQVTLKIQGEDIPRIIDNPIKCLGKWFDANLKDKEAINHPQISQSKNLKTIDKTGLPGKLKVWIY
jgi:hypothetical protein